MATAMLDETTPLEDAPVVPGEGPAFVTTDDGVLFRVVVYEGVGLYREGTPQEVLLALRERNRHNDEHKHEAGYAETFRESYELHRAQTCPELAARMLAEIADWWAMLPRLVAAEEQGRVCGVLTRTEKWLPRVTWLTKANDGDLKEPASELKVGVERYPTKAQAIAGETSRILRHLRDGLDRPGQRGSAKYGVSLEHLVKQSWPRATAILLSQLNTAWVDDFCDATEASTSRPVWDEESGELWFEGRLARKVAVQADNVRAILTSFQACGWRGWID